MRWCMAAGMSGSRPADVLAGRSGGGSSTGQLRARPSAARSYVHAYDLVIGLELGDVPMDGCITKAPCGGQRAGPSPVDRRKGGRKRSVASGGYGIPLGIASAGANRHDSPLPGPTLQAAGRQLDGILPEDRTCHLDRGYDSTVTRQLLDELRSEEH